MFNTKNLNKSREKEIDCFVGVVGVTRSLFLSVSLSFSPRRKDDVDAERGGRCGGDFRKRWYRVCRRGKRVCECFCVCVSRETVFFPIGFSLSLFLFVRVYYIYLYSLSVLVYDRGVREDLVRNEIPPPKRRKRRETTTEMSRTTTSTTRPVRVKTTKKSTRKRRNGIKS